MKKLIYLANQRLPTEKAYGIQIAKMCEAFAGAGVEVTLLIPSRDNSIRETIFDYYGVNKNFTVKKVSAPDFYFPGKLDRITVAIKSVVSSAILCRHVRAHYPQSIIYSRDEWPVYFLSFFKNLVVFEAHKFSPSRKFFYRRFKKSIRKIITISPGVRDEFIAFGFLPEVIAVAQDGVDLEEFDIPENQTEYRRQAGLPEDKKTVGYVGQLRTMGMEKGLAELIEAGGIIHKSYPDLALVVVGGNPADIDYYCKYAVQHGLGDKDIIFVGQKAHVHIPAYLKSFDILAMPFPYSKHYAHYMSPLKLFEYMAAKRPIIASDLPSIRAVVDDHDMLLVPPDDSDALAKGILKILDNPEFAQALARSSFIKAKEYTWQKRAEKIMSFIKFRR